jgi:phospholipid-binding lipoprotein MlaA
MKSICCIKNIASLAVIFFFLATGCAHSPVSASSPEQPAGAISQETAGEGVKLPSANLSEISAKPENGSDADEEFFDEIKGGEAVAIADPLEPFNRAMHHFNDKLYFWLLKPVAQGYSNVVPERARVSVGNFFSNLGFPARFLNCLLQADFRGAATEFGRFSINTIWGIGGLMDPAAGKDLDLRKQDADLGLTLAYYGVGHGFYLVWPVFGPSSPRDSLTILGDYFLYPVSYLNPWYYGLGTKSLQIVNETSLRIGDYESLKDAAIDPYVAFRDAYLQYRLKKVKGRIAQTETVKAQDK